jgi:hypothetical protein
MFFSFVATSGYLKIKAEADQHPTRKSRALTRCLEHQLMRRNLTYEFDPPIVIAQAQFSSYKNHILIERLNISRAGFWVLYQAHHQIALCSFTAPIWQEKAVPVMDMLLA